MRVRALRALHKLSLIAHTPGALNQTVRVHQLVQRATRDTLASGQHHQLARTAADAVLIAWPAIERDSELAQALRANTTALTTCAEDAPYRPDTHVVLYHSGSSLGEAGQVTAATRYFQHLAATSSRNLSPHHPNTLTARDYLTHWRGRTGDAAGAATAFAELLADQLRVLGHAPLHPHHPRQPGLLARRGWRRCRRSNRLGTTAVRPAASVR
ncbi:hypothetical protein GO001_29040 [Streptomyces sp. NRRL B-1677]|uniref:hypothetical protein n=1 Tax=Streptomyces sp. NRRL B-1677 TaxID=2682966 RepID=UPI001892A415|nr:hypothetical protein [Streptomyces sp. NRRL B-1677]MBF6049195.1 hypothetical protein [Streptomyces sp. NRRL B-1677]